MDKFVSSVPDSFFSMTAIGWHQLVMYFLLMFLGIMIGQDIWQRIFTGKDEKVVKYGTVGAGLFSVLWGCAMAVVGITAYILFPTLEHSQMALAEVVVNIMPNGVMGMVVAALLSALMSSSSGQTLAASTLIVNDLIKPFSKNMTDKKELAYSRVCTGLVGIVVLFLAVRIGDVLDALDIAYALLSGCVFIPVMAGFFWKKASAKGAILSIVISLVVTVICIVSFGSTSPWTISLGFLASGVGLVGGSLLLPEQGSEKQEQWEALVSGN